MKRIQFYLSKTLLYLLSAALQLAAIVLMLQKFNNYLALYNLASFIVSIVAVLIIVNDRMNPGFKIAWLILILSFPIFGLLIYLLYGRKKNNKRLQNNMSSVREWMQLNLAEGKNEVALDLRIRDPHAFRQSNYIKNKSFYPVYQNSSCSYHSPGEAAYEVILKELEKAEEFIFMNFFIVEHGKFWDSVLDILVKKVCMGVDVRLIYDDVGSLFRLPKNYDKKLKDIGIHCQRFNPLKPIVTAGMNNRDHRKILLIDGKTVFTGGINLADEYINAIELFGYWKDSVIMVKGDAVWSFTVMFLSSWNNLSKTKEDIFRYKRNMILDDQYKPSGFVQPYADTPLDYECISETVYLNLINIATDYIYITTPYLIIDHEMITALCNAAKSGVDVRIITPKIPDKKPVHMMTRSFYPILLESGVKIYEFTPGFIHSKTFITDGIYGIVGTVNLDYRSLYLHYECGVWMYQTQCLKDIEKDFHDTLRVSQLITYEMSHKICLHVRLICSVLRIFAPLF